MLGLVLLLLVVNVGVDLGVNVSANHVNGGAHDDVNGIVLVVSMTAWSCISLVCSES